MLNRRQTLHEVRGLLERLAGVTVRGDRLADDIAELDLVICRGASLLELQRCCLAANVEIRPWVKPAAAEKHAQAIPPMECTLSARADGLDERVSCGNLQLLGIHLVWALHAVGVLPTDQSNERLRAWNGALVNR